MGGGGADGVRWQAEDLLAKHRRRAGDYPPLTIARIGVGLNPLHGLCGCGQFDTTASTRDSARAEIISRAEPPEQESAEAHYRQAVARADELGMRPLAAHCHLGLGKLYRRLGKRKEAQEHLTSATTMYREIGMSFWLQEAEAAEGPME